MKKTPDKQSRQLDKFIETARDLGCDESEAAFNAMLKKLAEPKKTAKSNDKKK